MSRWKWTVLFLALMIFSYLTGCTKQVSDPNERTDNYVSDFIAAQYSDTVFSLPGETANAVSLAIDENERMFIAAHEKDIISCTADGDILDTYENTGDIFALEYADGYLYGVNVQTKDIVRLDTKTGTLEVLYQHLDMVQVNSFEVLAGKIYMVLTTDFDLYNIQVESDGYINYNEKRELEEIQTVDNPITLYVSSTGNLYIYAHPDKHYILYEYHTESAKLSEIAEMDDTGYLYAFVLENNTVTYMDVRGNVKSKNLNTNVVYHVAQKQPSAFDGNCFTYFCGSILYIHEAQSEPAELSYSELVTIRFENDTASVYQEGKEEIPYRGTITLSFGNDTIDSTSFINTEEIYNRSGIQTTIIESYEDEAAYCTALMAGDNTTDIYILKARYNDLYDYLENAGYVSLNESEGITDFLNGCFPWVRDAVTLSNGEIAMFPLWFDLPGVWYSEKLFEEFGLTQDDFATFDGMLATHERILKEKGEYMTLIHFQDTFWNTMLQYESLFCDYENGEANFNTELFAHLFEKLFSGWNRYSDIEHPVLEYDEYVLWHDDNAARALREKGYHYAIFEYHPKITIYTVERGRVFLNLHTFFANNFNQMASPPYPSLEDWRVLPMPVIHEDVKSGICTEAVYLVINPNSDHVELALEYLEALAQDFIGATNLVTFIQEDITAYEEYYDMSLPVYQDVYALFKDADTYSARLSPNEMKSVYQDYQSGHITLEEAVKEIDRKARFFAGE